MNLYELVHECINSCHRWALYKYTDLPRSYDRVCAGEWRDSWMKAMIDAEVINSLCNKEETARIAFNKSVFEQSGRGHDSVQEKR